MDLQMAWKTRTVWLVHFAERTGGELAIFTAHILTANTSEAEVPCCAVAIRDTSLSAISVPMAFADALSVCHLAQAQYGKKGTENWGICPWLCFCVRDGCAKSLTS